MKFLFSIGPWLMELFNPPPRDSLTIIQKVGRVFLVLVTLVTICIISALVISVGLLLLQRSREVLLGVPQLMNILIILTVSIAVNIVCIRMLFEIRRLDRLLIPGQPLEIKISLPPRDKSAAGKAKA